MEAKMRRIILTAFVGVVAFAVFATGCLDRKPAPVCPVPIEIASTTVTAGQFDGVDMLVVVDNSGSMAEEQQILSTGFFTLVNSLTRPIAATWSYPPVDNMRVAIVSSDMGLQYGEDGSVEGVEPVNSCNDLDGDNGAFLPIQPSVTTINVESGVIACEEGGGQCPAEFQCVNGLCNAQGGVPTVNCVPVTEAGGWAETTKAVPDDGLTTQVACLAMQGTDGCGVEQQLEASVRGLETHPEFLVKSHLLAVLVVSDEEDCSVENPALYLTDDWTSGPADRLNVACNLTPENEANLFDPKRYYDKLVEAKGNAAKAVIFAAIVGVPLVDECQGPGDAIGSCLDHADMQLELGEFTTSEGTPFKHYVPACTRMSGDVEVTSARPGRRYVQVAANFEKNGYVYSICNSIWDKAMEQIAEIIARQISATCYPKQLDWNLLALKDREQLGCSKCGEARCDVVVEIRRDVDAPEGTSCPEEFYTGLDDAEKKRYMNRKEVQDITNDSGAVEAKKIICPLPKIPTPKSCSEAGSWVNENYQDRVGWYYCETEGENFQNACEDTYDNDLDGFVDCADDDCADCTNCTGGTGVNCPSDKCSYGVELTQTGKDVTTGFMINVQCLQRFRFEDQNCMEDSPSSCTNKEDDDGNGVWDCWSTINDPEAAKPHIADSNCCPMVVGTGNICEPDEAKIKKNCKTDVPWYEVDACQERYKELGCTPAGVGTGK
jgi:hypothetical protein